MNLSQTFGSSKFWSILSCGRPSWTKGVYTLRTPFCSIFYWVIAIYLILCFLLVLLLYFIQSFLISYSRHKMFVILLLVWMGKCCCCHFLATVIGVLFQNFSLKSFQISNTNPKTFKLKSFWAFCICLCALSAAPWPRPLTSHIYALVLRKSENEFLMLAINIAGKCPTQSLLSFSFSTEISQRKRWDVLGMKLLWATAESCRKRWVVENQSEFGKGSLPNLFKPIGWLATFC